MVVWVCFVFVSLLSNLLIALAFFGEGVKFFGHSLIDEVGIFGVCAFLLLRHRQQISLLVPSCIVLLGFAAWALWSWFATWQLVSLRWGIVFLNCALIAQLIRMGAVSFNRKSVFLSVCALLLSHAAMFVAELLVGEAHIFQGQWYQGSARVGFSLIVCLFITFGVLRDFRFGFVDGWFLLFGLVIFGASYGWVGDVRTIKLGLPAVVLICYCVGNRLSFGDKRKLKFLFALSLFPLIAGGLESGDILAHMEYQFGSIYCLLYECNQANLPEGLSWAVDGADARIRPLEVVLDGLCGNSLSFGSGFGSSKTWCLDSLDFEELGFEPAGRYALVPALLVEVGFFGILGLAALVIANLYSARVRGSKDFWILCALVIFCVAMSFLINLYESMLFWILIFLGRHLFSGVRIRLDVP